jgi:hypothetical protein
LGTFYFKAYLHAPTPADFTGIDTIAVAYIAQPEITDISPNTTDNNSAGGEKV